MKCNQCEMIQISTGGISMPCHEIGCPNAHKVWNEEDQEWVNPEPEENEDDDPNFCPKCGDHFFCHNDDGSCVNDEPVDDEEEEFFEG